MLSLLNLPQSTIQLRCTERLVVRHGQHHLPHRLCRDEALVLRDRNGRHHVGSVVAVDSDDGALVYDVRIHGEISPEVADSTTLHPPLTTEDVETLLGWLREDRRHLSLEQELDELLGRVPAALGARRRRRA